jgi:hypothetical protein
MKYIFVNPAKGLVLTIIIIANLSLHKYVWRPKDCSLTTTLLIDMAVFWFITPCSLVEVYRDFRGACCLHHQGNDRPDYTAQQSRRQPSSYMPPWKPEISRMLDDDKYIGSQFPPSLSSISKQLHLLIMVYMCSCYNDTYSNQPRW